MSALIICLNEMKFDLHNTLMISREEDYKQVVKRGEAVAFDLCM